MILEINLKKITHNSSQIVKMSKENNLNVTGITKGILGNTKIASAMKKGGINKFGDSRVQSIDKLLKAGFRDITLIKQPLKHEVALVTDKVRNIYVSTIEAIENISLQAKKKKIKQDITLLVETGDCRDGFLPDDLIKSINKIKSLKDINIKGVATNIACARHVKTGLHQINDLIDITKKLDLGEIEISAANSSSIPLLETGNIPESVSEIRVGEAILLGQETIDYTPIEGFFQDAFIIKVEVIEANNKCGKNQILVPLGKADIGAGQLKPRGFEAEYIRSTSDHTIVGVKNDEPFFYSQELKFIPDYYALLSLMISPYVEKKYITDDGTKVSNIS